MAYYGAFSLFPLCLVLIAILGMIMRISPQAQNEQQQLLELVAQNAGPAGPWLADQLGGLLAGVQARAGLGGPIGVLTLLIAAIGVFMQLDYMFDRIWGTNPASSPGWLATLRSLLYGRIVAFVMLLAAGGLLMVVFLAGLAMAAVRPYLVQLPAGRTAWHATRLIFPLVTNALLVGVIYKVLPKVRVPWRPALAGGLLVSLVWLLGQQVLTSLLIGGGYTAYGVVGSFIAIMLWMYYASAVLFFGAEFVRALSQK